MFSFVLAVCATEDQDIVSVESKGESSGDLAADEDPTLGGAAKKADDFHPAWIAAWKGTQNYSLWRATVNEKVLTSQVAVGHPSRLEGGLEEVRTEVLRSGPLSFALSPSFYQPSPLLRTGGWRILTRSPPLCRPRSPRR